MTGYDTAGQIQNVYASAASEFGADPEFWVRYFSPSPAANLFSDDPSSEALGAWDSGGAYVSCICAPDQSRLSGSSAEGQADAQSMASSIQSSLSAVSQLSVPSQLWCWLDQEASTSLSLDYWNGWASYIASYNLDSNGTYPMHPGLYCDPASAYPNCSTISQASGTAAPVAVWSSEPEPCSGFTAPSWNPDSCSSVATKLWQYGEQGACGYSADVDLDTGVPGAAFSSYCLRVTSAP
ncbi:MAG: hypothetical protein J2P25_11335 [Nocardiopsaceae bacterium]|nr:hypothetical protein [Nocardiopsaceae bacterium]